MMIKADEHNLVLARSVSSVDEINASFYGRFPYPWTAASFESLQDENFQTMMVNQDLGDWSHQTLVQRPRIWVAGCGTNQAIFTALKFPGGSVVGSDVSAASLEICGNIAKELNVTNLELRQESLNEVGYRNQFDFVISTGVIHHNADPTATLKRLALALKPGGILELMVYNRFHWIIPVAFQQAIRILGTGSGQNNFESELSIAKRIIEDVPEDLLLAEHLSQYLDATESQIADELLQPVMYSYTVSSLFGMAESCGLEILTPVVNQFDREYGNYDWSLQFKDPVLRDTYESLPDLERWQVSNLLMLDRSPMLWFYLQRKDSGRERKPEKQICEEFLNTTFAKARTTRRNYIRDEDGRYRLSPNIVPFPSAAPAASIRELYEASDGKTAMREIFRRLDISTSFNNVNLVRLRLATTGFPYLKAVRPGETGLPNDRPGIDLIRGKLSRSNQKRFKTLKPKGIPLPPRED